MPIIYDIETLSGSGISSNDGIFILDASDQTMSSAGSNKLEFAQSFSQPVEATEEQFLTLNTIPAISEDLTLEITPVNSSLEISGNLLDSNGDTISRKTTFFKNTLLSSASHTTWNTENDISISVNSGPGNKAYGVIGVVFETFSIPKYWSLKYFDDNAQLIGEWRAGNTNVAIPAGLTFEAVQGSGTPSVFDNSKFAFSDNSELSKTVSTTTGVFLTESEIDRVSNSIESLSYLSVSNSKYSFQRTLDPIHFQKNKSSLIFSNLSSLQAHLIDLLLIRNQNFGSRELTANSQINDFFFKSSATRRSFDIADLFPISSLSDVNPGPKLVDREGSIAISTNGYINENYNYMVGVLAKVLNTTQSFVNLEIARRIQRGNFEELFFDNSNFLQSFLEDFFDDGVTSFVYDIPGDQFNNNVARTYSTAGSRINGKIIWDAEVGGVIFVISWDGSKWIQTISASPGTENTVHTDDTKYPWRDANGELRSNFSNLQNPNLNISLIASNYALLLNTNNDVKTAAIESFNFATSTIQSQSKIVLSESSRKNVFSEIASEVVGFFPSGEPINFLLATSLSDKSDIYNINLDKFSEDAVNQNYSLVGSNQGKGFYLSEDERFEIIYGLTGSSPSVDSITFNESSGEYTVTLAGLDGGFSYQIEFDNILGSTYNTSGTITGIKTDAQTLPISNNFRIDLISGGENQSASFKLLESKDASLNDPSSSGEFSFGDIKFLRAEELIDSQQTIDPAWIVRSSDVRKNFTASLGGSVQNISGENYFVVSINDTAGLVFDIQGTDSLSNPYQLVEASVRGSDETITRNFKLSETPYSFFRLSAFFSEEKDLFYHTGQASESMSPLGLNEGWLNLSTNSGESPVIVTSGAQYTGDISISGFSMLFEFKNLISGNSYKKVLPEFVQFESDTNIYLINGNEIAPSDSFAAFIRNGVEFTAESSTHIAPIPYAISGSANLGNTEFLLQQDRDFLLLEDSTNIIVGNEGGNTAITELGIDETVELSFVENQALFFNDHSDIKISIPAGTTTGIITP